MSRADGFLDARWEGKSIRKAHWHFHAQLYRRYGIILGPGDFSEMLRAIRTGSAQMVHKPSAKKAIYAIRLPHIWKRFFVLVVNGHVVTALPDTREYRRLERIN